MADFGDTSGEPWYVAPLLALAVLLFAVITAPIMLITSLFSSED